MSYTIIRSNGTTLPSIPDGNINTSSTSLGLPGRNYPGYGQVLNTNFVRLTENFAADTPPQNALKGQIWYNTVDNTLRVCPADGTTNAASWPAVATTATGGGQYTFGNITVTGNVAGNNLSLSHDISCEDIVATTMTLSEKITVDTANVTTANIGTTRTQIITTGAATTTGTLTGTWTVTGPSSGNAIAIVQGSLGVSGSSGSSVGIKCDNYMYANGQPFTPSGTYTNSNVSNYLTGSGGVAQFTGNIAPTKITTSTIAGGGNISGIWTLDSGSRIQATYADLAERYEADAVYPVGTVVEIGGDKEVTAAAELSENVFGVVSNSYAYLLNENAGTDETHPPIALVGRVNVNVVGPVVKGQRLVSAGNGSARAGRSVELTPFNVIGRALEHKTTEGSGTVLAVVSITK